MRRRLAAGGRAAADGSRRTGEPARLGPTISRTPRGAYVRSSRLPKSSPHARGEPEPKRTRPRRPTRQGCRGRVRTPPSPRDWIVRPRAGGSERSCPRTSLAGSPLVENPLDGARPHNKPEPGFEYFHWGSGVPGPNDAGRPTAFIPPSVSGLFVQAPAAPTGVPLSRMTMVPDLTRSMRALRPFLASVMVVVRIWLFWPAAPGPSSQRYRAAATSRRIEVSIPTRLLFGGQYVERRRPSIRPKASSFAEGRLLSHALSGLGHPIPCSRLASSAVSRWTGSTLPTVASGAVPPWRARAAATNRSKTASASGARGHPRGGTGPSRSAACDAAAPPPTRRSGQSG